MVCALQILLAGIKLRYGLFKFFIFKHVISWMEYLLGWPSMAPFYCDHQRNVWSSWFTRVAGVRRCWIPSWDDDGDFHRWTTTVTILKQQVTLKWRWIIDVDVGFVFILNIDTRHSLKKSKKLFEWRNGANSETICKVRISLKHPSVVIDLEFVHDNSKCYLKTSVITGPGTVICGANHLPV